MRLMVPVIRWMEVKLLPIFSCVGDEGYPAELDTTAAPLSDPATLLESNEVTALADTFEETVPNRAFADPSYAYRFGELRLL